jgi:hypothetical protein
MDKAEQFEGENMSHDQAMEGGWSKKHQPSGCNRRGKRQKLTAGGTEKQYLDSLKQIGKRMQETNSDSKRMFLRTLLPAMKQLSPLHKKKKTPSTKTETFFSSRIPADNIRKHVISFSFSSI